MALTTVNITGTFNFPDATWSQYAKAEFHISGFDTDTEVVIPKTITSTLGATGALDVDIWGNDDGIRGTVYRVYVVVYEGASYARELIRRDLGLIQISGDGPFDIANLLNTPAIVPEAWYRTITQAEYDAAIAAVTAAEAARDATIAVAATTFSTDAEFIAADLTSYPDGTIVRAEDALHIKVTGALATSAASIKNDWEYVASPTVPGLIASVQSMAEGDVKRADIYRYEVAASGATDHHLATAGGVKLYALPNANAITAKQIGITDGSNGTAIFTQFCASRLTGITRFVCDVDFDLASPSNTGFTVPSAIVIESDNLDQIGRGEDATRTIGLMNLISQRATANSLTKQNGMFDAAKFRARGMRFAYDVDVTEAEITGNGNGGAVFYDVSGSGSGFFAEKCKADFLSGYMARITGHSYWRVTNCWAGKQFYFLYMNGRCDHGTFNDNNGQAGYRDSLGTNNYGDYIKVGAGVDNFGPRFCSVYGNHMINAFRDGVDSTGGLHGWKITNNIFDCVTAAIDAKQQVVNSDTITTNELNFNGLTIANNVIIGGEIIFTLNEHLTNYGATVPEWQKVRGVTCSGNVFVPRAGRENCGYYFKGVSNVSVNGDNFTSYRLQKAADFDPATSGAFPSSSVEGTYYEATSAATIDGLAISIGDFVVPKIDGASTAESADWVIKNTAWLSCSMFRTDNGESSGYSNQGSWDASAGTFPVSTSDGQYFTVSVAGTVDDVRFDVGNFLVALVDNASTTVYGSDWVKRRVAYFPSPAKNVSFKNIIWDARGGATCTLDECEEISLHFASLITDHSKTFDVRATAYGVSLGGKLDAYPDEFSPATNVEPITIQTGGEVHIDFDAKYHGSDGRQDFIRQETTGASLWVDGNYENFRAPIRSLQPMTALNLGMGRGFYSRDCNFVFVRTTGANPVRKGLMVNVNLSNGIASTQTGLTGNLYDLDPGAGLELTIAAGVITATNAVHTVDTEADAATDDLDTIDGGQGGDRLIITAANTARTVVIKHATGNLTLAGAADYSLDDDVKYISLERAPSGNWHELSRG